MERQIGEIFDYKGIRLEVVEGESCDECFLRQACFDLNVSILGYCGGALRSDGKYVYFKKVE